MNLEKMKKMAGRMEKCIRVLQIVFVIYMAVFICLMSAAGIANAMHPENSDIETMTTVEVGHITVAVEPERQTDTEWVAWSAIVLYAVCTVGVWYILQLFRRILAPIREGDPFSGTVSRDIRKIGWTVVGLGVTSNLINLLEAIGEWIMIVPELADGSLGSYLIHSVTFKYTFEAGFLVVFVILMLVAWIFEYGAELQKLSDETL
ncbi:MAG: DUF2975 domain-containing protein [Clostridia bacterium]|nr:DUF2975 domain-containing protein [Clostridia bacterium]